MQKQQLQNIIEGALLAFGQPLTVEKLQSLFVKDDLHEEAGEQNLPEKQAIQEALEAIQAECAERGFELKKVSSGWRFQVKTDVAPWVNRLWEEKPQRYSRALLETLAIIAYRQPITRGDIEEIRGVAVSSHIIKTLTEREWIKVVGQRDVPGRPSLYATTRQFLDYFNLENLESLPTLRELADIDSLTPELALELGETEKTGEENSQSSEAVSEEEVSQEEVREEEVREEENQEIEVVEALDEPEDSVESDTGLESEVEKPDA